MGRFKSQFTVRFYIFIFVFTFLFLHFYACFADNFLCFLILVVGDAPSPNAHYTLQRKQGCGCGVRPVKLGATSNSLYLVLYVLL